MRKSRLRRGPIRRRVPFRFTGNQATPRPGAQLPCQRGLLRSREPGRRRRARGRAGGPEPGPPPGLPGQRLRRRLPRLDPADRLPVHLHLRRLALSPAGRGRLAPRVRRSPRRRCPAAVYAPVGWATHYHADYVVPYWASTLAKNAIVGAHIFLSLGAAAGDSRRPSPRAMPAASPTRPRCATPRSPPTHVDRRSERRRRSTGDRQDPRRRGAQARAVDARRQARRGPLQPGRAQGVRRGAARGLCRRSSKRRTTSNMRCRATPRRRTRSRSARRPPRRRRPRARAAPRPGPSSAAGCGMRRELQLDPQPDPVEPAVDRQIIVRQRRRRAPLPPGHRELAERALVPQRIAVLQLNHRIVERRAAVELARGSGRCAAGGGNRGSRRERHFVAASARCAAPRARPRRSAPG